MFYNILFMLVSCFVFWFSILYKLRFCIVLLLFLLCAVCFPFFVQVYQPLPPGGDPIAINK